MKEENFKLNYDSFIDFHCVVRDVMGANRGDFGIGDSETDTVLGQ